MRMRSTISLPDRIRGLAAERHLTQEALGEILGVTRPAIRRRLRGQTEFSASELEKLSHTFGVSIAVIFGEPAHTALATSTSPVAAADGAGVRLLDTTGAPGDGE